MGMHAGKQKIIVTLVLLVAFVKLVALVEVV